MTDFALVVCAGIVFSGMLVFNWLAWRQDRADRRAKLDSTTKNT